MIANDKNIIYNTKIKQNNKFYVNITTVKGKCFKCAINVDNCKTVDGRCQIMKIIEKNIKIFIINLEQVDYIDSSGIGALIYINSTIKKMNLKLAISNIHGSVKKVIELTKLMGYFPIANSVEEALLMVKE